MPPEAELPIGESDSFDDGFTTVPPPGSDFGIPEADTTTPVRRQTSEAGGWAEYWPWAVGVGILVVLLLGAFAWSRRRANEPQDHLLSTRPTPIPVKKSGAAHAAQAEPEVPIPLEDRVDISLDIVSASRSFMMFSLEYRLTMANRTDRAVRDLSVSGQLVCAERGAASSPAGLTGQLIGEIERIGPHQSRSLTGQVQMPLTEVRAIQQGGKPLFIPLLHVLIAEEGKPALNRSFVVGNPSTTGHGKLHPLPLDTPPGGLPGLKAREISLTPA